MPITCAQCRAPIDPKKASDPCPKCGSTDRNIVVSNHGSAINQELLDRIRNTEDNFTERKLEGAKRGEIRETIVAFANSIPEGRTAVLFIGVKNDGSIHGISNPDSLQKTIRETCEKDCYPPIIPRCEVLHVDGKPILAVVVSHSNDRPHFSGPAYVRIGSENVSASKQIFEELITYRVSKACEILKWKGKTVTVVARGKYLGNPQYLGDPRYYATHECEIEGCTSQYVSLQDNNTGQHLSEPLENVTLATDEKKLGRLKLIVSEKI
jgi:hypothetical protein